MPDIYMDVDAAVVVPMNVLPLLDDTDFKTVEAGLVYNSSGIKVYWHFVTCAGAMTSTEIHPTTAGVHDISEPIADIGMYAIEIPASGGDHANNDTEGVGWITGVATGMLPWRGPTIGFRRAALNDLFIDGGTASTNLEDFFDGTGYAGGTARLKADVDTIKTQAVTCAAGVTVLAQVGAAGAPGAANGLVTTNGTKVNQTVDLTAGQSIACSDKTGFSLSSTGADLILKSSTFIQAIVAAVNEFATYGLTALNTLLVTTGIKTASLANDSITAAAIAAGAIDNATFAADVGSTALATNMIAKAAEKAVGVAGVSLTNTGIPAATVTALGTGSGLTALATAAELAKVPKSDSNVSWNATALAAINAEVDTALNTAIPGGPTAHSVNERLVAIDDLVQAGGAGDLAAVLTDTGTTLDGKLNTIDGYLNNEVALILAAVDTEVNAIKTQTDLLPSGIKKNTALANFEFFMALASDHVSAATGKTITSARSIDGGAFGACANSAAEVSNGVYKISLAAADLNGDVITLRFSEAACDDTFITIKTQA